MQRVEQDALDIRCMQLLRAIIHNEERRLPADWETDRRSNTKYNAVTVVIAVCKHEIDCLKQPFVFRHIA